VKMGKEDCLGCYGSGHVYLPHKGEFICPYCEGSGKMIKRSNDEKTIQLR
jgi:uncharacterized Zn-finger protein